MNFFFYKSDLLKNCKNKQTGIHILETEFGHNFFFLFPYVKHN